MAAKKKATGQDDVLLVGVDLGTARSAVCASNGVRAWDQSLVGWPRDAVARKLVKSDVVFGSDCLRHRLALDVHRPLENGVIHTGTDLSEEAVHALAGHLMSLARPQSGQPVRAVIGAPAEASAFNKQLLRDAFSELVDACMIVSEPFSVAYGLDMLMDALVIDIGAGTLDLCIMRGTAPTAADQRTLEQAGDYIDRQLAEILGEQFPNAQFTNTMLVRWKEEHGFVGSNGSRVPVTIPVRGKPTDHDISSPLRAACESILPHLTEELTDLIASFDPEFQQQVRENIILAGGCSQIRGLSDALTECLEELGGGRVTTVTDPLYVGAEGALSMAQDTTDEDWTQLRKTR